MFDGFSEHYLPIGRGTVFARIGGSGPPVLLLHGYPQTHLMWHAAAAHLASRFTVVAADLPGYGASFRPSAAPDHAAHSKRALAVDLLQAMSAAGFERFAVVGHDRGGRVGYRLALDHPGRLTALAVLDIVPTGEVWARADASLALGYWHWALGLGAAPGRYPAEVMTVYRQLLDDPGTVQAICEDYRAGAGIDRDHDDADLGRHRIECPVLVLWSAHGALPRFYGDVLDAWHPWAHQVTGQPMPATHFIAEDQPEQTADVLTEFLGQHVTTPEPHRPGNREGPAMSPDAIHQPRPADALAATLKRTEIQRGPLSLPGREMVQVRTEIPPGVASGWHTHPGEEVGYIIAGTVQMEIRDRPPLTLNAGDGFLIPPRVPHNALDLGPGTGLMLSTYIIEAGQPIASVAG